MSRRRLLGGNRGSGGTLPVPTSEWKLEETSGTTVFDSKGINNGVAPTDCANLTGIGVVGNWYNFEGYGAVVCNANPSFDIFDGTTSKKFTLSLWMDIQVPNSSVNVASYRNGSTLIWQFVSFSNVFQFYLYNPNGTTINLPFPTTGTATITNGLHHVVLVFDPTETAANRLKGYVDTVRNPNNTTGTFVSARYNAGAKFGFGGRVDVPSSINQSRTALDQIKYYSNYALTLEEVTGIYNSEKP